MVLFSTLSYLFNFLEDPGFDQGSPASHHGQAIVLLLPVCQLIVSQDITIAYDGHVGLAGELAYQLPISRFLVPVEHKQQGTL
jgi:hypothetical protein